MNLVCTADIVDVGPRDVYEFSTYDEAGNQWMIDVPEAGVFHGFIDQVSERCRPDGEIEIVRDLEVTFVGLKFRRLSGGIIIADATHADWTGR